MVNIVEIPTKIIVQKGEAIANMIQFLFKNKVLFLLTVISFNVLSSF